MKGFTFIELLIYIGIVAVVLVLATSFAFDIIEGSIKNSSFREVQQNARFAMDRVSYQLREGENPSIFSVTDEVLYENGIPLTTDQVKVVNFDIVSVADTYLIELEIEHLNPAERGEYRASVSFKSTVSPRVGSADPPQSCWGTGGSCDSLCLYYSQGNLTDYYQDPDCSEDCPPAGNFYLDPDGPCDNNGMGNCYKPVSSSTEPTSCSQGSSCEESCAGTCTPCEEIPLWQCNKQSGCSVQSFQCVGTCDSCGTFSNERRCIRQQGCSWVAKWYWELGGIEDGYTGYINCDWYEL